jgi:Bacterial low temperature requirement A protein (LtrA)
VQRVTNIELFFDLVYVFAVTQLSHYLLELGGERPRGRHAPRLEQQGQREQAVGAHKRKVSRYR